jgi:hypothetical protein
MEFFVATLTGALIIAGAAFFRRSSDRMMDFTLAAFFASYPILLAMATLTIEYLRPRTIDLTLFHADGAIGLDPFSLINLVAHARWLNLLLFFAYVSLPIVIALAWVLERSPVMLRAVAIAPLAAFVLYLLFPAVGPIYALTRSAPHMLVPWEQIANVPRNCFPSMHLGWALLVALNARRPAWRAVTWSFAVLTGFATVGLGEHYYVDLIVAAPFCLVIQYVAAAMTLRGRPFAKGLRTPEKECL